MNISLNKSSIFQVFNEKERKLAQQNEYNFDHPDAFDFDLLIETLRKLKEGKSVDVPIYNFVTHSREKRMVSKYQCFFFLFFIINTRGSNIGFTVYRNCCMMYRTRAASMLFWHLVKKKKKKWGGGEKVKKLLLFFGKLCSYHLLWLFGTIIS